MKTAILLIFCGLVLLMCGCSGPGVTASEINRKHVNTIQTDWTMIQEDIDRILWLERPKRLSEYYVR